MLTFQALKSVVRGQIFISLIINPLGLETVKVGKRCMHHGLLMPSAPDYQIIVCVCPDFTYEKTVISHTKSAHQHLSIVLYWVSGPW